MNKQSNNFFGRGALLFSPISGGVIEPLDAKEMSALKRLKLTKLILKAFLLFSAIVCIAVTLRGITSPTWKVREADLIDLNARRSNLDEVMAKYQRQRKLVNGNINLAPWVAAISKRVADSQQVEQASGSLDNGIFTFRVSVRFGENDDKTEQYVTAINTALGKNGSVSDSSMRLDSANGTTVKIHTLNGTFYQNGQERSGQ